MSIILNRRTIMLSTLPGVWAVSHGAKTVPAPDVFDTVLQATEQGRAVRLRYGEDGPGHRARTLQPLRLLRGWNGVVYLQAWQVAGPSRSGTMRAVKTFRLDRMRAPRLAGRVSARTGLIGRLRAQPPGFIREVVALRPDLGAEHTRWLGHDRAVHGRAPTSVRR